MRHRSTAVPSNALFGAWPITHLGKVGRSLFSSLTLFMTAPAGAASEQSKKVSVSRKSLHPEVRLQLRAQPSLLQIYLHKSTSICTKSYVQIRTAVSSQDNIGLEMCHGSGGQQRPPKPAGG